MACQICGAKSGFYPLCNDCFKLRDEGKVKKCEECGIWKRDAKPLCLECWHQKNDAQKKPSSQEQNNFRSKFPATMRTEDGHMVRSRAELLIDNWLYRNGIVHAYERKVPIGEEVYCDFFIPLGQTVWIEYWGSEETTYLKRKELKKKYYAENKKNLIELTDKDIENLDDNMPTKLMKYLPKNYF